MIFIVLMLMLWPSYALAFDSSEFRQDTYGAPTHYCDPTRSLSSSGSGTLGDPWNMNQCRTQPVAGNVVGILAVGSGTPVAIASTADDNVPAFNPSNSGTSSSPIVYTCRYAAVALDYSTITSNPNRCEFRHDGTPDDSDTRGSGSAMLGGNGRNYIIYDGFFINMTYAEPTEDSGVIRCENTTGIQFRNFVIKGKVTDIDSNAVIYRSGGCTNTVLSNFLVRDYYNNPMGSGLNQPGLFSDQYGDWNFTIEHFDIGFPADAARIPSGIYLKGTHTSIGNYGVVRYGIVRNAGVCVRLNAIHSTHTAEFHHLVCEGTRQSRSFLFSSETENARNVLIHHATAVKGVTSSSDDGCFGDRDNGATGFGSNNVIRDSICDLNSSTQGYNFLAGYGAPATLDYIGHVKYGSTMRWRRAGGSDQTSISSWRTDCSCEANSVTATTSPFVDRDGGDYHLADGHAWLTASSTGGPIGAYDGGTEPGLDLEGTPPAIKNRLRGGAQIRGGGKF